jgi:hypothetical protein
MGTEALPWHYPHWVNGVQEVAMKYAQVMGRAVLSSNRMQEENTLSDRPVVSPSKGYHHEQLRAAAADDSRFTAVAYEIAFGDRRVRIAELREIAAALIGTEPQTRDRYGLLREIQKHQAQG